MMLKPSSVLASHHPSAPAASMPATHPTPGAQKELPAPLQAFRAAKALKLTLPTPGLNPSATPSTHSTTASNSPPSGAAAKRQRRRTFAGANSPSGKGKCVSFAATVDHLISPASNRSTGSSSSLRSSSSSGTSSTTPPVPPSPPWYRAWWRLLLRCRP